MKAGRCDNNARNLGIAYLRDSCGLSEFSLKLHRLGIDGRTDRRTDREREMTD